MQQEQYGVMFDGFALEMVDVSDDVRLRVRIGGSGPAVVLLHGHPRTHTTWYRVAPQIAAAGFTVVCPDLRGYGRSTAPRPRPDHAQASKRAMGGDVIALIGQLGFGRFAAVGHDRGSYVAFRLAMDNPARVTRLAVLDCVPIGEALARADARFARAWWRWFFFAQPELPERAILTDPYAWYRAGSEKESRWARRTTPISSRPSTIRTSFGRCLRTTARPGRRPWTRRRGQRHRPPARMSDPGRLVQARRYGTPLRRPARGWRPWARDLRAVAIDSGHHIAEENPDDLATALIDHLAATR